MNRLPAYAFWSGRRLGLLVSVHFDRVVYFDGGPTLKGAQNSIASGNNLVAFFEAAEDFDVCGAGDAGGYRNEFRALFFVVGPKDVDSLDELGLGGSASGGGYSA